MLKPKASTISAKGERDAGQTPHVRLTPAHVPTACSARDLVFCDIGSGCGRLVMAQALKWPWRCCRGIEKIQALHDMGNAAMSAAGQMVQRGEEIIAGSVEPVVSPEASRLLQAMAPCALSLGDVNEDEVCPS